MTLSELLELRNTDAAGYERIMSEVARDALPPSATAPHAHTDECWEPDSGCDMGRNAEFARTVPRLCPRCNRNWISGEEACDCDGPPSTVGEKP